MRTSHTIASHERERQEASHKSVCNAASTAINILREKGRICKGGFTDNYACVGGVAHNHVDDGGQPHRVKQCRMTKSTSGCSGKEVQSCNSIQHDKRGEALVAWSSLASGVCVASMKLVPGTSPPGCFGTDAPSGQQKAREDSLVERPGETRVCGAACSAHRDRTITLTVSFGGSNVSSVCSSPAEAQVGCPCCRLGKGPHRTTQCHVRLGSKGSAEVGPYRDPPPPSTGGKGEARDTLRWKSLDCRRASPRGFSSRRTLFWRK